MIPDSREIGVYRPGARRIDRDQARLVQFALLEIREVEGAVADGGSTGAGAVLRLGQRESRAGKRVGRVQALVTEVAIEIAVQRVGAASRHHTDVSAERASELGLAAGGHHLELVHGVEAVEDAAESGGIVVGGQAVNDEAVREITLACYRDSLAGDRGGFGEELGAGGIGWRYARHEKCEIQEIAAVEREVADFR